MAPYYRINDSGSTPNDLWFQWFIEHLDDYTEEDAKADLASMASTGWLIEADSEEEAEEIAMRLHEEKGTSWVFYGVKEIDPVTFREHAIYLELVSPRGA